MVRTMLVWEGEAERRSRERSKEAPTGLTLAAAQAGPALLHRPPKGPGSG